MNKPTVFAAAALIALASLSPSGARAGDDGALAAGIIGGLAVGALAGSAIASTDRGPIYVYDAPPYVRRAKPRVRVYHYFTAPRYSHHDDDYDASSPDYSSGYHDGYHDAVSEW